MWRQLTDLSAGPAEEEPMSDNPRLEYEGNVELTKEEGYYWVIGLDGDDLAREIFKTFKPEITDVDKDFPDRKIKARITVEVLETEVIDQPVREAPEIPVDDPLPLSHPLHPDNWPAPVLPEGQIDNPQEA
jgi:hypothetical protein